MKRRIRTLTAAFLTMCILMTTGCGSSNGSGLGSGLNSRNTPDGGVTQSTTWLDSTELSTQIVESGGRLQTVKIENDYYSVTVPYGWTWEEWGVGAGFCFRCVNPEDPSMVIFYAGALAPIFTSEQQKQPYYSLGQPLYTDAPVFADQTVSSIYTNWEYIVQYQIKYQGFSLFPVMTDIRDQGSQITNDAMHTMNTNYTDSIGSAYATSENGTPVIALTKASIGGDPMDLFALGYDSNPKNIYAMYFVECPQSKSEYVQQLMDCVQSLQFTEKAIQEAQGY